MDLFSKCKELYEKIRYFEYGIPVDGVIKGVPSPEYFAKNYHFLKPEEFEKYGGGICWDYVEYERKCLEVNDIDFNQYYLITNTPPNYDTHTFITVKDGDELIYIESSFKRVEHIIDGVQKFKTLEDIVRLITTNMWYCNDNDKRFDEFKYDVCKFKGHPQYGCTCQEYMDWMDNNSDIVIQDVTINPKKVNEDELTVESVNLFQEGLFNFGKPKEPVDVMAKLSETFGELSEAQKEIITSRVNVRTYAPFFEKYDKKLYETFGSMSEKLVDKLLEHEKDVMDSINGLPEGVVPVGRIDVIPNIDKLIDAYESFEKGTIDEYDFYKAYGGYKDNPSYDLAYVRVYADKDGKIYSCLSQDGKYTLIENSFDEFVSKYGKNEYRFKLNKNEYTISRYYDSKSGVDKFTYPAYKCNNEFHTTYKLESDDLITVGFLYARLSDNVPGTFNPDAAGDDDPTDFPVSYDSRKEFERQCTEHGIGSPSINRKMKVIGLTFHKTEMSSNSVYLSNLKYVFALNESLDKPFVTVDVKNGEITDIKFNDTIKESYTDPEEFDETLHDHIADEDDVYNESYIGEATVPSGKVAFLYKKWSTKNKEQFNTLDVFWDIINKYIKDHNIPISNVCGYGTDWTGYGTDFVYGIFFKNQQTIPNDLLETMKKKIPDIKVKDLNIPTKFDGYETCPNSKMEQTYDKIWDKGFLMYELEEYPDDDTIKIHYKYKVLYSENEEWNKRWEEYKKNKKPVSINESWTDFKNGVHPSSGLMFHVSLKNDMDGKTINPQLPSYITDGGELDDNYQEDTKTKRLCVSPSIEGCLIAILSYNKIREHVGDKFYVYTPEKPFSQYKHKTNKEIVKDKLVFDANITKEAWILEPCKLKLYGIIKLKKVKDLKKKPTVEKNIKMNTIKLDYEWIMTPKASGKFNKAIGDSPDKEDTKEKPIKEYDNVLVSNDEFFMEASKNERRRQREIEANLQKDVSERDSERSRESVNEKHRDKKEAKHLEDMAKSKPKKSSSNRNKIKILNILDYDPKTNTIKGNIKLPDGSIKKRIPYIIENKVMGQTGPALMTIDEFKQQIELLLSDEEESFFFDKPTLSGAERGAMEKVLKSLERFEAAGEKFIIAIPRAFLNKRHFTGLGASLHELGHLNYALDKSDSAEMDRAKKYRDDMKDKLTTNSPSWKHLAEDDPEVKKLTGFDSSNEFSADKYAADRVGIRNYERMLKNLISFAKRTSKKPVEDMVKKTIENMDMYLKLDEYNDTFGESNRKFLKRVRKSILDTSDYISNSIQDADKSIIEHKQHVKEIDKKIAELNKQIKEYKSRSVALVSSCNNLVKEIDRLQKERDEHSEEIRNKRTERKDAQTRADTAIKSGFSSMLKNLRKQIADYYKWLTDYDVELESRVNYVKKFYEKKNIGESCLIMDNEEFFMEANKNLVKSLKILDYDPETKTIKCDIPGYDGKPIKRVIFLIDDYISQEKGDGSVGLVAAKKELLEKYRSKTSDPKKLKAIDADIKYLNTRNDNEWAISIPRKILKTRNLQNLITVNHELGHIYCNETTSDDEWKEMQRWQRSRDEYDDIDRSVKNADHAISTEELYADTYAADKVSANALQKTDEKTFKKFKQDMSGYIKKAKVKQQKILNRLKSLPNKLTEEEEFEIKKQARDLVVEIRKLHKPGLPDSQQDPKALAMIKEVLKLEKKLDRSKDLPFEKNMIETELYNIGDALDLYASAIKNLNIEHLTHHAYANKKDRIKFESFSVLVSNDEFFDLTE